MATAKKPAPVRKTTPKAAAKPTPAPVKAVQAAKPAKAPAPAKAPQTAKAVQAVKPVKVPKVEKVEKPEKPKKAKLVRDSFTIPKPEYVVLDDLKQRAAKLGASTKKSELLRAGIKALAAMSDTAFKAALAAVPAIKTGRPKTDKAD